MYLRLELAGAPAGIAQREDCLFGPVALRQVAQDLQRGGQSDPVVHHDRFRVVVVGGVEDEAALVLHRPPEMDVEVPHVGARRDVQLAEQLSEVDRIEGLVDHQPHRAVLVVGAHVDHGTFEARIGHRRHGQ